MAKDQAPDSTPAPAAPLGIQDVIQLIELAAQYGIPAILSAVDAFKTAQGVEPTVAEARELMTGVKPPDIYPAG